MHYELHMHDIHTMHIGGEVGAHSAERPCTGRGGLPAENCSFVQLVRARWGQPTRQRGREALAQELEDGLQILREV